MSTRANIIIKDDISKLIFYRHSDGYPVGALPTLKKFMCLLNDGKIRNNTTQAAGWLIIIGALEYSEMGDINNWKVGAYEPTANLHGDISYLYTIDLKNKTLKVETAHYDNNKVSFSDETYIDYLKVQ